jgi:hypothetical protein
MEIAMRRLLAAIGFVLLFVPSVLAQQTKTKVGDMYLGEPFEEAFPVNYQKKFMDFLVTENHQNPINNTFYALTHGAQDGKVYFEDDPDENTTLHKELAFHNRRLVSVVYKFGPGTSFSSQLRFLTAKYGKPTTIETKTLQNGFGARWNCHQAFWIMANGDSIAEDEDVLDMHLHVTVLFYLKDTLKPRVEKSPY